MPVGRLEVGALADLVTLAPGHPVFAGASGPESCLDALLTAGDGRCFDQAWIGGQRHAPLEDVEFGNAVRRVMN